MNSIKIYGKLLALSLMVTSMTACNDEFLDRAPKDKLVSDTFWDGEEAMKLYVNTMYKNNIWGHHEDPARPPFAQRGSHLVYATEMFSDNAASTRYNTSASLPTWHTDKYTVPTSVSSTHGWYWNEMRRINYFLNNYEKANLPDEVKETYAGEVLFFKAWDYYRKVQIFGDVPWYETDLNIDSPELYKARDKRKVVMGKVLECLDQAIEWLPDASGSSPAVDRINKDMANHLKSRICLYEGTYRKYHTELNLQSTAQTWLEECVKASQAIINTGHYRLYDNGDTDTYFHLFSFKDTEVRNVGEAILAAEYNQELGVNHDFQRYFGQANNHGGITALKSLVDEYLCADGRPIYSAGSPGAWTNNPLFKGFGKYIELDNRDPRMTQTIMRPGEYHSVWIYTATATDANIDGAKNGVEMPRIAGMEKSGYRFAKHFLPFGAAILQGNNGSQSAIEFRYGEVLLNLIEAKAELAELGGTAVTQADLDLTVNALRERGGYDFATYPTAKLTVGDNFADPRLDAIYTEKLGAPLPFLIREIRRERRVEMVLEDLRYWDLMRWKAGPLLTVPMRGILFNDELQSLYNGTHTSAATAVLNPVTGFKERAAKAILNTDVYTDTEGFLIVHPITPNIAPQTGILYWDDTHYYWPIPLSELNFPGTELKQTPGWEGK